VRQRKNRLPIPIHPGEILQEDYRKPLGPNMNRLARYFKASARYRLNLRAACDLEVAEDEIAAEIERGARPAVFDKSSLQTWTRKAVWCPDILYSL
jgi:plasmid maintenance system antidote protein VapI